jgi:lysophospholipase L1-like esterase
LGKNRSRVILYTVSVLCASITVGFFIIYPPPGYYKYCTLTLEKPFVYSEGFEYVGTIPLKGASDQRKSGIFSVVLMEDGKALPHPHSFRAAIQRQGKGAFLQQGRRVYFSASDNSDPNSNGKVYSAKYGERFPVALYLVLLFLGYAAALIILYGSGKGWFREHRSWQNIYYIVGNIILGAAIIQATFWILTENQLERHSPAVKDYYRYAFGGDVKRIKAVGTPGLAINYMPHQYLNYVLNPDVPYCGTKQFNRKYKIRRTEEIKERDRVKWRAVIIGGSTTFGEGLPLEENTWPYALEVLIRKHYGTNCDVMNGGVGGYTVLENFIHYVTMLRHLKPDVVILFVGINDVSPRLFSQLKIDYSNYRKPWSSDQPVFRLPNDTLSRFYPYRYYFLNKVIIETFNIGIAAVVSKKGPTAKEWKTALERNSSFLYQDILDSFIRVIKSDGAHPIIIPQLFRPVKKHDRIFMIGVRENNDANRKVAHRNSVPFAAFVLEPDVFVSSDFLDNCHFSKAGSKKMAKQIFAFLRDHNLLPPQVE